MYRDESHADLEEGTDQGGSEKDTVRFWARSVHRDAVHDAGRTSAILVERVEDLEKDRIRY